MTHNYRFQPGDEIENVYDTPGAYLAVVEEAKDETYRLRWIKRPALIAMCSADGKDTTLHRKDVLEAFYRRKI